MTAVPRAILIRRPSLSATKADANAPKNAPTTDDQQLLVVQSLRMFLPSNIATMTETIFCDGLLDVSLNALVVTRPISLDVFC